MRPGAAKGEVGRRALVIDDDAATRELIGTFLEAAGYEVLAADGGEAGIALAATSSPHIIILDLVMPGMDGYAVCRALGSHPTTRLVPIIMITGSDDPTLTRNAFAAGARACVPKPFRREALLAAMRAVVAGRARRDRADEGA